MRWSPEKLRWLMLGGAVLLAAVLAAFFGLAKYSRGKVWQRILARNGVNLTHDSSGITYSQSERGRTIFTVHASRSVPRGGGRYTLHDAVLILYGKDGRNDRISGSQFEYDQSQGLLRAVGEVHMDLEAPRAAGDQGPNARGRPLSFAPGDETAVDPGLIHVRTSGLVYMRRFGVAATQAPTEFRFGGLTCTSRGAEFDSGQDLLRLLSDVRLSGTLRNAPFALTAMRADLDRRANTADLEQPRLQMGEKTARADRARLLLRRDGSVRVGDASGSVELVAREDRIAAPVFHGEFGTENRLHRGIFSGGVTFANADVARATRGSAQMLELSMTPQGGLRTAVGSGGVALTEEQGGAQPVTRQMHAQQAVAEFIADAAVPKRAMLQTLHMTGAADFESAGSGATGQQASSSRISADDMTASFAQADDRRPELRRLVGAGHTRLEETGSQGGHQVSTGEALEASFAPRAGGATGTTVTLSSALQTGHVEVRSWGAATKAGPAAQPPMTGYAQKALFLAPEGTLTLSATGDERAQVDDAEMQLRAPEIVLHQGTGNAEASGGISATVTGEAGAATHVVSTRAALFHGEKISEFFGTRDQPAQVWQGGSQVQAARITLDGQRRTLSARPEGAAGTVSAVFATSPGPARAHSDLHDAASGQRGHASGEVRLPEASRDAVEIRAAAMDYNEAQHEAAFNGGVLLQNALGQVTGQRAVAFLQAGQSSHSAQTSGPATGKAPSAAIDLSGRLDRVVVAGGVRVSQPGRTGMGEQITYSAGSNDFVLTGTPADPPRLHDAQQGTISGATLVFAAGDSSIVVAGTHAPGNQAKPSRVHTETEIRRQ